MSGGRMTVGCGARILTIAGALLAGGAVSGCITINIYFPAAAAEKAADRIIDEVLGKGTEAAPKAPAK